MKEKEILYTIWLVIITAMVVMIYSRQTTALSGLNDSLSNQDTIKESQDHMIKNQDTLKASDVEVALGRINKKLNIQ